jgi:hypothetical protein
MRSIEREYSFNALTYSIGAIYGTRSCVLEIDSHLNAVTHSVAVRLALGTKLRFS